jgi:transposase
LPAVESTSPRPWPTIWELPDDLWEEIEPILDCFYPPARTGRPRADLRLVLDGIIHRLRSGCQWRRLPGQFGRPSTVHGWFQRFATDGFLEEVWAYLVRECEELGAVRWEWQAASRAPGVSCGRAASLYAAQAARLVSTEEQRLTVRLRQITGEHPRWGWRTAHQILLREGWRINHKRARPHLSCL